MAGFTRVLHRTSDDALSAEVPTLRVAPRTPACDDWCPFPVADRPEAVRSFFAAVRLSKGAKKTGIPGMEDEGEEGSSSAGSSPLYFFLAETDYLFLRPPQAPAVPSSFSSSSSFDGVAFPFGYIQPRSAVVAPILERLFRLSSSSSSSLAEVPNTGPSPVLLPLDGWLRLLPAWVAFAEAIERDHEAREVLGWIREMVRERESFNLFSFPLLPHLER